MDEETLAELLRAGESISVEFKSEKAGALSDNELIETVVCLANAGYQVRSSWLVIGAEDDGAPTGARPRHGSSTDPRRVQALIANRTRPSQTCRVEVSVVGGKELLVVEVPAARTPVGTADGKFARRALGGDGRPSCVPFHFTEMQGRIAGVLQDYTTLVVPDARWADLDPLEFDRFRRSARESRGAGDLELVDLSDEDLAKALGAVEANGDIRSIRVLALLLFGTEDALRRLLPTHEVAFQVLAGADLAVQTNEFFRLPLLRCMDELINRFRVRNREQEIVVGMLRVGVPDYPERAFREALANALVHRDYSAFGAVHIQWTEENVRISNPGGFPEGVHLRNLLVVPPTPRNPALADAFKRAGLVERTGRGVDTIFMEQLRHGRPKPSYENSSATHVVLELPGGASNLGFVKVVAEEEHANRPLGLEALLLLNQLHAIRRLTAADAAAVIQRSELDARRRLEQLVEAGLVEATRTRGGRSYQLSAALYRRLGTDSGYVRQRGFEALQHEQMTLQYAQTYGRITRSQVMELCQIGPHEARTLLRRLVRSGRLVIHGARRWAHYTEPKP